MKRYFVLVFAALFLMSAAAFAYSGDTVTGTTITAELGDNTLQYKDIGGVLQPTEEALSDIETTVISMYGFAGLGAPDDDTTTAGVPVYFEYLISNEGNASDTYGVKFDIDEQNGTFHANWTYAIKLASNEAVVSNADAAVGLVVVAEDGTIGISLEVTPSSSPVEADDGYFSLVTVTVTTDSVPVGVYTGANANIYGGTSEASDQTKTTISAGDMRLSRTSTVDAPTVHISNGGGANDAVPGAVITYLITASNEGSSNADDVIIVDKVPLNTTGNHISATGEAIANVTITAAAPSGTTASWIASYSTSDTPNMEYQGSGWVEITTDITSAEYVSATAKYVKWEKGTVVPGEYVTVTWGVAIE